MKAMTISAILTILILIALLLHAFNCADKDTADFDEQKRPDHGGNLKKRLLFGALAWFAVSVAWLLMWPYGMGYPRFGFLLLVPMGFGWWTMCFRLFLNAMREKSWYWMGPALDDRGPDDSGYDHFWHWLAWVAGGKRMVFIHDDHQGEEVYERSYGEKAPARLAYITEAVLFITSLLILFL